MTELRTPISLGAPINYGKAVLAVTVLGMIAALGFVSVVASGHAISNFDLRLAEWVQSLQIPGLGPIMAFTNFLMEAPMAFALWLLAGAFFVLRGRPLEAVAVFLISGVWIGNELLGMVVDRPVPSYGLFGDRGVLADR